MAAIEVNVGCEEGQKCGRQPGKCEGTIILAPAEGCSCHINPPCSACTSPRLLCDTCGWREVDDRSDIDWTANYDTQGNIRAWHPRKLDDTKIDYRTEHHTSSSMLKIGVCPEGTTREEVLKGIGEGTFGGRFEYFDGRKFRYIAYTD